MVGTNNGKIKLANEHKVAILYTMKADNTNHTITVKTFLQSNPTGAVRTNKYTAKSMLLNNESMIILGKVRYFAIKDLGLGVCEIALRPEDKTNTFVVKTFEKA